MRQLLPALLCLPFAFPALGADADQHAASRALSLWYNQPAAYTVRGTEDGGRYRTLIDEATLIGNGRCGAMIQGGVDRELLCLSENTLWTGGTNPDGFYMKNMGRFQTLGNLAIELIGQQPATRYRRSLDLTNAIAAVTYTASDVTYRREYFASHPDQVLVARFTASRPASYSGSVIFTDGHQRLSSYDKNRITTVGGLTNGLRYETQILVSSEGGSQKTGGKPYEEKIEFTRCDSLTLLIAAGTNYVMDARKLFLSPEDPHLKVSRQIDAAALQSYEKLKSAHIADYQSLFNRFSIDLGPSAPKQRALPTDRRCRQAATETDLEFERLACQYGRYLVIATSRKGGVASNGQGLWNDCNCPQFGARYTNDLAPTEMDYWSVEPTNLAECHLPLLDLIQSQIPAWKSDTYASEELKTTSGNLTTRGWETRGNHNIMGGQSHWWNKGGNAWYLNHFWEHYAFSNDTGYLKKVVYPLLKEVCQYWEDHLQPLPDGRLIVARMKYSPEHGPFEVDGCSYCQELVWDLFTNYLDACDVLKVDPEYRAKIASLREKLLVPGIGSWGQLLEWMTEMKDAPPLTDREKKEVASEGQIDTPANGHRHSSHLLAVYPLRQISWERTPELAAAAKVSTVARSKGRGSIGISFINRAPIFARLYEAELAYSEIRRFFLEARPNLMSLALYDAIPALPGAMAEMLLQSHQQNLHLLPALPKAWPTGAVKGIRARGGFEVDECWQHGKLAAVTIRSVAGHSIDVRYAGKTVRVDLRPGASVTLDADLHVKH